MHRLTPLAFLLLLAAAPPGPATTPSPPATPPPVTPTPSPASPSSAPPVVPATPTPGSPGGSPVKAIQSAAGFQDWGKVEEIRFTFVVNRAEKEIARSWTWKPAENVVTWTAGPDLGTLKAPYTYDRDALAAAPATSAGSSSAGAPPDPAAQMREVDARFINDSFWLLLPLHLGWSKEVVLTDIGQTPRPIGGTPARTVHVQYPAAGGGYTPGDAYDLWLDEAGRIVEWSYYPGGVTPAAMSTTWEGYQSFGPLLLSTERKGMDGALKLGFRDIVVVTGE